MPSRHARDVIRYAAAHGAMTSALLGASGIDRDAHEELDGFLPAGQMRALWAAADKQTGDPDFGLNVGIHADPTALSVVGYVVLSSETLGDALEALVRYYALLAVGRTARLDRGGDGRMAVFEMETAEAGTPYPPAEARQPFEASFAALLMLSQSVTGRALPVRAVAFAHGRPETGTATHETLFGVVPTFDATCYRLAFEPAALRWTGVGGSPSLNAVLTRVADSALGRHHSSRHARTAAAIADQLRRKVPTLADIARELSVGQRSLQHHLEDESTTFHGSSTTCGARSRVTTSTRSRGRSTKSRSCSATQSRGRSSGGPARLRGCTGRGAWPAQEAPGCPT